MSGIIGSVGGRSGIIGTTELDYEEGTWTPGIGSSGAMTGSANSALGKYIKVGKTIHLWFVLKDTSGANMYFDTERGYQNISGIPFTAWNPTDFLPYAGVWQGSGAQAGSGGSIYLGGTDIYISCPGGNPIGVEYFGAHITFRIE